MRVKTRDALDAAGLADEGGRAPHVRRVGRVAGERAGRRRPRPWSRGRPGRRRTSPTSRRAAGCERIQRGRRARLAARRAGRGSGAGRDPRRRSSRSSRARPSTSRRDAGARAGASVARSSARVRRRRSARSAVTVTPPPRSSVRALGERERARRRGRCARRSPSSPASRCRSTRPRGRRRARPVRGAGTELRGPGRGAERRPRLVRDREVEHLRAARGRQQPLERGQVALAQRRRPRRRSPRPRARARPRPAVPRGAPEACGAVEEPLDRRAERGGERLLEHAPVVVDVQVHDRAGAEAGERLAVDGAGGCELGDCVVRHGEDDRVHVVGAVRRGSGSGRRSRRAPGSRRGRAHRRASSAAAAGSAWRRWNGAAGTPMSAGVGGVEQAGRNTFTATASDASSAGRLRVGSAIRFQSASIAFCDWPCARSHEAERLRRRAQGRPDRARPSAAAARAAARRSAHAERRVAQKARGEVERRRQPRARDARRRQPLAQDGHAAGAAGAAAGGRSPIRRRKPEVGRAAAQRDVLAVVELRAPLRSNENVAPPSRERAS